MNQGLDNIRQVTEQGNAELSDYVENLSNTTKGEFERQVALVKSLDSRITPLEKNQRDLVQNLRATEEAARQQSLQGARSMQQFELTVAQLRGDLSNVARDRTPPILFK